MDLIQPFLIASEILSLRICSSYLRDTSERWRRARIFSKRCAKAFGSAVCAFLHAHKCTLAGSGILRCLEDAPWAASLHLLCPTRCFEDDTNQLDVFMHEVCDKFFAAKSECAGGSSYDYLMQTRKGGIKVTEAPQGAETLMSERFALDFNRLDFDGRCVRIYAMQAVRTHSASYRIPKILPSICHRPDVEKIAIWNNRGYNVQQDLAPCIHLVRRVASQFLRRNKEDCRACDFDEKCYWALPDRLPTCRFMYDPSNKMLVVSDGDWQVVFRQNRKRTGALNPSEHAKRIKAQ